MDTRTVNGIHVGSNSAPSAVSSTRSPFVVVWMFAAIVLSLFMLANQSFRILSSVRAYVGGESLWSKAQKDAVFHLQQYAATRRPAEFGLFRSRLAIPLGDRSARLEMNQLHPDRLKVELAFISAGNHPDDVEGMVALYRQFRWTPFMRRAIEAWTEGDRYIDELDQAGTALQRELASQDIRPERIQAILTQVAAINEAVTPVEDRFVEALSDASRITYRLLQAILLAATPVLLALGTVLSLRILHQRNRAENRFNHMAHHDELTGLPNRALLHQRLREAIDRHRKSGAPLAILFMDLDRFKVINDSLGHEAGDHLLRQVGTRLRAQAAAGDTVARMGGDEFAVLVEDRERFDELSAYTERLVNKLGAPYTLGPTECQVPMSIGISVYPAHGLDARELLKAADVAMYRAKEAGGGVYKYFTAEMTVHTPERLELESDLRHAIERGEFLLHYQPQIDLSTGSITGLEALLRWQHPTRGNIPPLEFIGLAEENGFIGPLGEWVLAAACMQNKVWQDGGHKRVPVAVNLSARQFADPLLLTHLTRIIRASGLDPASVELEITESTVMSHGEVAVAVLAGLKALGVRIAIDDFGTGYSSLAYLKRFPVDTIKVDRSFIRDIPADFGSEKITRAITAMAHGMDLKVVAEGVETAAQINFLRTLNCDTAQGYFFHPPLPAHDIAALLRADEDVPHFAARSGMAAATERGTLSSIRINPQRREKVR